MASSNQSERIPDHILTDDYLNVLHRAYEQMNDVFIRLQQQENLTQERIARRLGVNKSLVSRRLHGGENLTLRALSGLATAMECKLGLTFTPYKDLAAEGAQPATAETTRLRLEIGADDPGAAERSRTAAPHPPAKDSQPGTRGARKAFELKPVKRAMGGYAKAA